MRKIKLFSFTREVLKNMTSPPVTVNYPEEPAIYPQRMRGHIHIDIDQCISCTLCAQNCPPRAITVDRAAGTWSIDRFDCVQCGSCVNVHGTRLYAPRHQKAHRNIYPPQTRAQAAADI